MKHYFVWEWRKIKTDIKSINLIQRILFSKLDSLMWQMEGIPKKDYKEYDDWEARIVYKETNSKQEMDELTEKLKNIGFNKINEIIQKAKDGHFRLLPRKIREKLATIEREDGTSPIEKASMWMLTFGIYWDYKTYTERQFKKLEEK